MATLFDSSGFLDISTWRLNWRLEQHESPISPHHLAQMHVLGQKDAEHLWKLILDLRMHDDFPFKKGLFTSVESLSLRPVTNQDELASQNQTVKKWLFNRRIPFRQNVYLSYQPDTAIATSWKMLIRYWNLFYYSISDDLTVIDDTYTWALLFFHEHEIHFGSRIK